MHAREEGDGELVRGTGRAAPSAWAVSIVSTGQPIDISLSAQLLARVAPALLVRSGTLARSYVTRQLVLRPLDPRSNNVTTITSGRADGQDAKLMLQHALQQVRDPRQCDDAVRPA